MNKKVLLSIIAGSVVLIIIVIAGVNELKENEFVRQLMDFSVTVVNKSEFDLISVEAGLIQSDATGKLVEVEVKHLYPREIKRGEQAVIRPRLSIKGVGSIFIDYTDSNGTVTRQTVCSYTETASGYAVVTILNGKAKVQERCS